LKFREIINRLSGFSTPLGGVQWEPAVLEVEAARRVIAYLEDRRVLYEESTAEMPDHCVQSVLQMRETLTHEVGGLKADGDLAPHLRAMRAACRKFLSVIGELDAEIQPFRHYMGYQEWVFLIALGEMRGVFGVQVGQVAAMFEFDVEDPLATIIPTADAE